MNTIDTLTSVDAFNFDAMNKAVGKDPFAAQANKYAKDERFYTLIKDKEGDGAAIIRFIPDAEMNRITEPMYRIGTTITKNGKKRFVNEFTPATISLPCPFQEKWADLYNAGDKEGAKVFSRSKRFISNIKVITDPANPENEGKVFLYEYSGTFKAKLDGAQKPSEKDIKLGKKAKEIFNPLQGNSFRLVAQKGTNGQINYDASEFISEIDSIYADAPSAVQDIRDNSFLLSGLFKPEAFMSYEDLQKKMKWVTWDTSDAETTVAPVASSAPEVQPVVAPVAVAPVAVAPVVAPVAVPVAPVANDAAANELAALMAGFEQK